MRSPIAFDQVEFHYRFFGEMMVCSRWNFLAKATPIRHFAAKVPRKFGQVIDVI